MSDFISRLQSDSPKAWKFKEDGPTVVGFCRRIEEGIPKQGEPCPVVTLELDQEFHKPEDGTERSVWAFHAVLERELARVRPKLGERIGIHYNGRVAPEGGREYESYRVDVDRKDGEAAFEWSNYGHHIEPPNRPEVPEVEAPDDGPDEAPF